MADTQEAAVAAFRKVQDHICAFLSREEGRPYREDAWEYSQGGGGGISRVWEDGPLLEKGGVNFSAIHGDSLPPAASTQFRIPAGTPYFASGVSLVLHPRNPHVPTVHLNIRYFEAGEAWWFGGGMDVTPYYPVTGQVAAYHRALRDLCRDHGRDYDALKRECDRYFFLKHRGEARGVGGLFYDHVQNDRAADLAFNQALGMAFPDLFGTFLANRDRPWSQPQRDFQLYRRARYVEFNLLYDRGTLFGLQSGGRTESILMSMPPLAKWVYGFQAEPGSDEARLTDFFLKPQDWVDLT